MAPVKAPFSWPNSSLSTSPAGRAAQLILMSGLSFRRLLEWIARAIEFLARPRLARDEDGGIGRRDPPDVIEHGRQARASPDDLLEIVDALDLFLQVQVLLFEAGLFLFHQYAIGDVHDHGARVFPVRLRPGIPLHPDRAAVVLAPEFNHDAACVRALANRQEGLANASLVLGRVRHQRHPNRPGYFLGLETQNPHCRPVGGDKARFEIFLDVTDRRFLEEVPVPFFTLLVLPFVAQPLQFRRRARGEDAHGEQFARLRGHRLLVEDGQVAQMFSFRVAQRHAEVTLDSPIHQ